MNIFTNNNKIEALTQQVNDLTERVEKLEYILRRYPPPYNPYFTPQATPYSPQNNINMDQNTTYINQGINPGININAPYIKE
jgi:hypothetical protein